MEDISKLCMACLSTKDENNICPRCKGDADLVQKSPLLPLKYILAERYCIAKAVKQNGEGISYAAYDLKLDKAVSVREFFPAAIASRELDEITVLSSPGSEMDYTACRTAFDELWRKLLRLRGLSALISVTAVFQANNTIYAVYDESEALNLRSYLLSTAAGYITWDKARILFMPVLSTLGTLHTSGVLHKGINPASFIFSKDGKLKLTDFCTDAVRTVLGDLEAEIFDGYAPLEQYSVNSAIGTWSDIYSFCAVLYRALIGTSPIDAKTRAQNDQMMIPAKFAEQLPPYVINALINGMQIDSRDRTRNVEQLRSNLSASPRAVSASAPVYAASPVSPAAAEPYVRPAAPVTPAPAPVQRTAPIAPGNDAYIEKVEQYKAEIEKNEQKRKDRKKNFLIALLCCILIALLAGIGFLIKAITDLNAQEIETTTILETTSVPQFVGMEIRVIMANTVYTSNFNITQEVRNDAAVAAGTVIEQSIAAGSQIEKGSTINLVVSAGPVTVTLDSMAGRTYDEAAAILSARGFRCVKGYKYNDGTNPADVVIETIPPAGSNVQEGSEIQIIVWQQPETTAAPTAFESESSSSGNSVQDFINNLLP